MIHLNAPPDQTSAIALRDVCGYIPLSHACIRECGPAARVFGALFDLKDKRTRSLFHSQGKIAAHAGVSLRTLAGHLQALNDNEWIDWGRRAPGRRTCDITITDYAIGHNRPFSPLPLWFSGNWSVAVTYSALLGKAFAREKALTDGDFEHIVDDEPFSIRRSTIEDITCLPSRSLKRAFATLRQQGLIERTSFAGEQYPAETTLLFPVELSARRGVKIA